MPGKIELARCDPGELDGAVDRLLGELRLRFGLKRDDLLERKALGVLRQRASGTVRRWLDDLMARPADDSAWLAVVDAVTIHETFFFRDPGQLAVLRDSLLPALIRERMGANDRRLSLWSAGCASGEEAYSLAIMVLQALEQAGEPAAAWSIGILGTDLCASMVAHARTGIYGGPGLNAFRQLPAGLDRFFEDVDEQRLLRRVAGPVHGMAQFRRHNLMSADPPLTSADIVLCRNVFIYFDEDSQRRAVEMLASSMCAGGHLLLGVTDRLHDGCGFERESTGTAVIYRRTGAQP